MARRLFLASVLSLTLVIAVPATALACGGLIAPGHAEVLRRATTLAAWHDGVEHYVTGFQFAGSASSFGYIIPLPAEPTKIQKGGEWTLERLQQEVAPVTDGVLLAEAGASVDQRVTVLQEVRIEALDISVVKGGGPDVAEWAEEHGFDLTSDTPDVLGHYSDDGAIFALAKFDNREAAKRGFVEGQGTVIHFTIPTKAPWVPLRILALGKHGSETVEADLFLLTDDRPQLSPDVRNVTWGRQVAPGWTSLHSGWASEQLLADLRSDKGMGWLPASGMWFTALSMSAPAPSLDYDLSIDGGAPTAVPVPRPQGTGPAAWPFWLALAGLGTIVVVGFRSGRSGLRPAV
jgi:Uncharacterized protein conserved in bacteria (DUF2330)